MPKRPERADPRRATAIALGVLMIAAVILALIAGCATKPPSCWENPRHIDCVLGTKQF